jgi:hypothetical protein
MGKRTASSTPACGAQLRGKPGQHCQLPGTGAGGRCRFHGGKSAKAGPTHHTWKHGRRSQFTKHLPEHLRAAFDASASDPDLLSVRNEIALADSRLHDLLDKLTSGESAARMLSLRGLVKAMGNELRKADPNPAALAMAVERMGAVLDAAFGDDSVWAQIQAIMGTRMQLTETERRVADSKKANVDADSLRLLLQMILSSVRQHVLPLAGGSDAVGGVAEDIFKMTGMNRTVN